MIIDSNVFSSLIVFMILKYWLRVRPIPIINRPVRLFSELIQTMGLNSTNPYDNYPKHHLLYLAKSGELSVNDLILLSNSLRKHNEYDRTIYTFIVKQLRNTPNILFGTFLQAFHPADNIPLDLLTFYIQSFSLWNRDYHEELKVTELLDARIRKWRDQMEEYLHKKAKEMNSKKMINGFFKAGVMDSKALIKFTRFFKGGVDQQQLAQQFQNKYQKPNTNEEAILLAYLIKDIDVNIQIEPSFHTLDPKSICLLCELAIQNQKCELQNILQTLVFDQFWTYQTITWVSEFLSPEKLEEAHHYLISNCNLTNTQTLMIYARRLPSHLRLSLCEWLCNQQKYLYDTFQVLDLIDVLEYLPEKEFKPYLEMLMKEARGNYEWEEVNKLYYYAKLWEMESEHTESLRLYVVTGYISLGINRRMISTASYFYKIIELVPPEDLYKFKIDFGDNVRKV